MICQLCNKAQAEIKSTYTSSRGPETWFACMKCMDYNWNVVMLRGTSVEKDGRQKSVRFAGKHIPQYRDTVIFAPITEQDEIEFKEESK